MTGLKKLLMWKASGGAGPVTPLVEATASGNPATFTTDVSLPLKACTVSFEPVQDGSGDPSPENVRPISGWTGAKVYRTGKNLLPPKKYQYTATQVRLGSETADEAYSTLKAGTYTLSLQANVSVTCYYKDYNGNTVSIGQNGGTFTLSEDTFLVIYCYKSGSLSADDIIKWQLELGSTATPYEPYTGQTVDVQFPSEAGTVYGGTLDVVNGTLTVDRAMVDLGTLNWAVPISTNPYCFTARDLTSIIKGRENVVCSAYDVLKGASSSSAINNAPDKVCIINKGVDATTGNYPVGTIIIKDSSYESYTKEEFKTAMSGVQLVYELATPITYQLTPQQIRTIRGENHIWSDANGSIELTYLKKA